MGKILLTPGSAILPDGSSGNAAPALSSVQGTEANPKKHYIIASFDPATDEHLWWQLSLPGYTGGNLTLDIFWYSNDIGANETCYWKASIAAITEADTDTPVEHASGTAQTANEDVNATEARRLMKTTITISNLDSVADGDLVYLMIGRDADNGSDDLSSDADFIMAILSYS